MGIYGKYKVGDRVICINAGPLPGLSATNQVREGREYFITAIDVECGSQFLNIEALPCPGDPLGLADDVTGISAERFLLLSPSYNLPMVDHSKDHGLVWAPLEPMTAPASVPQPVKPLTPGNVFKDRLAFTKLYPPAGEFGPGIARLDLKPPQKDTTRWALDEDLLCEDVS